jgi:hypothetical protein
MTFHRVVFTKTAQRQLQTEAAKWRERHTKNTYLLEDEGPRGGPSAKPH